VALNASSPATGTTYADTALASGQVTCYIAQSLQTVNGQKGTSAPSNIAGPYTTPATGSAHLTTLTWTNPGSGTFTYLVSRVDAISTAVPIPSLNTAPVISDGAIPRPAPAAKDAPVELVARVAR
jgi:hypothetical protein